MVEGPLAIENARACINARPVPYAAILPRAQNGAA